MEDVRDRDNTSILAGRYSLMKKLGEGGKGMVYKAHDNTLDRIVAIKMLKSETLDEEVYARFMREAQSAARLNHPNIVSMHDMGKDSNGRYFLVMEFVSGKSLRGLLESQNGSGLGLATSVGIAIDVCRALSYAHSQGVLHRDIKPENIMLTQDAGVAKLMDFGLAKALDKPRLTREGMMVGTPAYMAPENALGRESDARSDIYSLGCVLYEMLVGSPPFRSADSLKTIYSHINDTPTLPSKMNPEVPTVLEAIVVKAMMKDPAARFQTASDFLRSLEEASRGLSTTVDRRAAQDRILVPVSSSSTHLPTPDLRRTLPLIDRETELASLKSALDAAMRRQGSIVFLAGEAGIGKTRLAEEVMTYANLRGVRTLTGRCLEKESGAPYSSWVEITTGVVTQMSPQLLQKTSGIYGDEIAKLVPELLEKLARPSASGDEPISAGEVNQERIRFLEGISQFFVNLSRESPLLLLLDDLNSADASSIQLLRHLSRKLEKEAIMIVGTYRSADLEKTSPLFQLTLDLNRERLLNTIHLKPLEIRSLALMIAETFGEREENQTEEFRNLIFEKTGGNPFFVEEVLRSLVEQGVIYRTDNGWERKTISEIEVPPTVKAVIEQRLGRLDDESLTVLSAASVLGKQFSFELLQQVTGIDEDSLLGRVEKILKARLLSEKSLGGGRSVYELTDLQVRDLLLAGISLVRRRKFHLRTGQVMEKLYKDKLDERASELAHHFLEGNDHEKALHYSVKAGERAATVYAHDEACRQLKIALELLDEKDDRALRSRVLEKLGDELWPSNKIDVLLKCYDEAAKICESMAEQRRAGEIYLKMMEVHETVLLDKSGTFENGNRALKLLSEGSPSEALAYVYVALGQAYWWTGERDQAIEMHRKGLELAKKLGAYKAEALAYMDSCYAFPIREKERGLEYAQKGLDVALEHNLLFQACYAFGHLGESQYLVRGDCKKAAQLLLEGVDYASRVGYYLSIGPWYRVGTAAAFYTRMGKWKEAEEIADEVFKSFRSQSPLTKAYTLSALGILAMYHGELEKSEKYLKEMLPLIKGFNDYQYIAHCYVPLARVLIEKNESEQAESYLRYGHELVKRVGLTVETSMPFVVVLSAIIELRLRQGKMEEARRHLQELLDAAKEIDERWARAYAWREEGMVASSQRDWERATISYRKSVDCWEKLGWPYERARSMYELGIAYQESGDRRSASDSFNTALDVFMQLGAKLDIERVLARKELLKA